MKESFGQIKKIVTRALAEDLGPGDITTNVLIPKDKISDGIIMTREAAVISGLRIAAMVFIKVDNKIILKPLVKDGQRVKANTRLASLQGKTRSILKAERVALNFLSHLSAIATKTREFVNAIDGYPAKIMDTRKTTPNLRILERAAVRQGGGVNHRFGLNDMVLIKDNHRVATHKRLSFKEMIPLCRQRTHKPIEIEVDDLKQFNEALEANPNFILLDNMSTAQIEKAVKLRNQQKRYRHIKLEVSGGITLQNVRALAQTGIDRISIGALTHTKKAIDVSLELLN